MCSKPVVLAQSYSLEATTGVSFESSDSAPPDFKITVLSKTSLLKARLTGLKPTSPHRWTSASRKS